MKPIVSAKERAWRARNPTLAAKFDRLSAGAKANIRTNGFGKGTAELTRLADSYRRQDVKARSSQRRSKIRIDNWLDRFTSMNKVERRLASHRPKNLSAHEERLAWAEYDALMGR